MISSPPVSEEWRATQTDHANALDSLGTTDQLSLGCRQAGGPHMGVSCLSVGGWGGEGEMEGARLPPLNQMGDDGRWCFTGLHRHHQAASYTPDDDARPRTSNPKPQMSCPRKETSSLPHPLTQDLETDPKKEIQSPVTNQDSNLPPPQATHPSINPKKMAPAAQWPPQVPS